MHAGIGPVVPFVRFGIGTNRTLVGAVAFSALLQVGIVMSPLGQQIFKVARLNIQEWLITAGLGLFPLLVMEIWKVARMGGHEGNSASRNV